MNRGCSSVIRAKSPGKVCLHLASAVWGRTITEGEFRRANCVMIGTAATLGGHAKPSNAAVLRDFRSIQTRSFERPCGAMTAREVVLDLIGDDGAPLLSHGQSEAAQRSFVNATCRKLFAS